MKTIGSLSKRDIENMKVAVEEGIRFQRQLIGDMNLTKKENRNRNLLDIVYWENGVGYNYLDFFDLHARYLWILQERIEIEEKRWATKN